MGNSESLFEAVLQMNFAAADNMTAAGITLDGYIKTALTQGSGKRSEEDHSERLMIGLEFDGFINNASEDEFAAVSEKLFELLGEPLYYHYNDFHYAFFLNNYYEPKIFETLLKCYNNKSMRRQDTMHEIIYNNRVDLLMICGKYGWLKIPRIRDAVIEYSREYDRPECTAWLLEFTSSTADLAAERERADKKAERELNAAPDSVTALKALWKYKKREDGSIIITGYKGSRMEITVPAKIGKNEVKAIGERAFSPYASRLTREAREFRQTIVKITLPDSVCEIGKEAFRECKKLRFVNIPYGVSEIADKTFVDCDALENIEIPGSAKTIGEKAFLRCDSLEKIVIHEGVEQICRDAFAKCLNLKTVEFPRSLKIIANRQFSWIDPDDFTLIVPRDSFAEQFCKAREYKNINYIYKE